MGEEQIEQALVVLEALGMPRAQQNERSALTLLALLDLKPGGSWEDIQEPLVGITPIMDWMREHYGKVYAPNTRETVRRQTIHQFREGGLILQNPDDPSRAVNSPANVYQVAPAARNLLLTFGTDEWDAELADYLSNVGSLSATYARTRAMAQVPVNVPGGQQLTLSPGVHSELIRDIIQEFGPRFVPGAHLIYAGDTAQKVGVFDSEMLASLGVEVDNHGKMPDVVLYDASREWLVLVEAVTSHGPVDAKRYGELNIVFEDARPGLVFVSAFPDRAVMRKYLADIAWETEVWAADAPDHLIHFNGERFLGPY